MTRYIYDEYIAVRRVVGAPERNDPERSWWTPCDKCNAMPGEIHKCGMRGTHKFYSSLISGDHIEIIHNVKVASVDDITDGELLRRAVRSFKPTRSILALPRWSRVARVFSLGSTYAAQLCRRYGCDPDERVK